MTASIASNLSLWLGLRSGWGLWALSLSMGLNVLVQSVFIGIRYEKFFKRLFFTPVFEQIAWKKEVLPVQWRLAVGGMLNYFATSIFTPVMFWYHGAAIAGQMGIGFQIMIAVQAIALTWIHVNVPTFGALVARKEYQKLDALFFRLVGISFGALVFLCAAACLLVKALIIFYPQLGARFMPLIPLSLFLSAAVFMHVPLCLVTYLRAHKKEPLLAMSVVSSLAIGISVWFFGKQYGLVGAGASYLGVIVTIIIPAILAIWTSSRRTWHNQSHAV
jgi:hypothetical protein